MVRIDWLSPRKYTWIINAFCFHWEKHRNCRDPRYWVFGAWEGKKYDDNSRALFEYVNIYHPDDIHAVWITNKSDIVTKVRDLGYEAYMADSTEGRDAQRRAGVAFYTNGLIDFGLYPKVAGSVIVSLWHGVGFKAIYNDKYKGLQLLAKRLMDKVFSWTYRDVTVTTSTYVNSQFSSIFGLKESDDIVICGQPRNDVLRGSFDKEAILSRIGISKDRKIVLYMPTYRGRQLGDDAMSTIVKDLYDDNEINSALTKTNCVFVVKLHPLTPKPDICDRDNFVVLDNAVVESTQTLLAISDALITDYSSCVVDYALLDRPVKFYTPDHELFVSKSEPLYDVFYKLCKDRCSTPQELAWWVLNPDNKAVDLINDIFMDPAIKESCYCENVYKAIEERLGK